MSELPFLGLAFCQAVDSHYGLLLWDGRGVGSPQVSLVKWRMEQKSCQKLICSTCQKHLLQDAGYAEGRTCGLWGGCRNTRWLMYPGETPQFSPHCSIVFYPPTAHRDDWQSRHARRPHTDCSSILPFWHVTKTWIELVLKGELTEIYQQLYSTQWHTLKGSVLHPNLKAKKVFFCLSVLWRQMTRNTK